MEEHNAENYIEPIQKAETDFSALLQAAIEKKQAKEAERAKSTAEKIKEEPEETEEANHIKSWKITPRQVTLINLCDREALDEFYFDKDNNHHILCLAYCFMRRNGYLYSIISVEDLMQQVYVDFRTGMLKIKPHDKAITRAIFNSFRYAAVGGLDEVYIAQEVDGRCRKAAN